MSTNPINYKNTRGSPGFPLEQHSYPAGRGQRATFTIQKTGGRKPCNKGKKKKDYVDIIVRGRNPITCLTHNLDTGQTSFTFYHKAGNYFNYERLENHDRQEMLAYLLAMKMRERRERDRTSHSSSSPSTSSRFEPENVYATYTIPQNIRVTADLRRRIENINAKLDGAERKRRAAH